MWCVLLLVALTSAPPWILVSQIIRQECQSLPRTGSGGNVCRPYAGQREPQVHQVQTFGTVDECVKVREQMLHQVEESLAAVNTLVKSHSPEWYLQTRTTFLCLPHEGTTEEQWR